MKKIFIYYSLNGNGDVVAHYLKKQGYDIRKVITKEPLPKNFLLQILFGGYKALKEYEDKLLDFDNDITEYNEVIIGTPIWNDRLSAPINAVLKELNVTNKKIGFILYSGKGKTKEAKNRLNKMYGNPKIINLQEPKKNRKELTKIKF